jgi:hypothetical protein
MAISDPTAFLDELERTVLSHPVLTSRLWADLEHGRCGRSRSVRSPRTTSTTYSTRGSTKRRR